MQSQDQPTLKVIEKPIHAKPSLYAYYFELIKAIGKKYGYNIVLHGSMNRDLDLVAIPWQELLGDKDQMIDEICEVLGGTLLMKERSVDNLDGQRFTTTHHGRMLYIVNINRDIAHIYDGIKSTIKAHNDPQYYLDISVLPTKHENLKVEIPCIENPLPEKIIQSGDTVDKVLQLLRSKNFVEMHVTFFRDKVNGKEFKKEFIIENILTGVGSILDDVVDDEVRAQLTFEAQVKRNNDRINQIKQYLDVV